MSKLSFGKHVYDVENVRIGKTEEPGTNVPAEAFEVEIAPPKARGERGIFRFADVGSFEMTLTNLQMDDAARAFFFGDYKRAQPDHILRLNVNGQVETYLQVKDADGNLLHEGWCYFSPLDAFVWRWAIIEGFQIEDAVTELNRRWNRINLTTQTIEAE